MAGRGLILPCRNIVPLTPSAKLALTSASVKTLTFLDHYGNLQVLECIGLLLYESSGTPLFWQERSMQPTKPFFYLSIKTNTSYLFWRFSLVISDYGCLSFLFSSSSTTALLYSPFCNNQWKWEIPKGPGERCYVYSCALEEVDSELCLSSHSLQRLPSPLPLHGVSDLDRRRKSCLMLTPHCAWSWSSPVSWLPGLNWSPYPGRCPKSRAVAVPVLSGCSGPG